MSSRLSPFESLKRDTAAFESAMSRLSKGKGLLGEHEFSATELVSFAESSVDFDPRRLSDRAMMEAIILLEGRPSLLIQEGRVKTIRDPEWKRRLTPYLATLEATFASVGRVELLHHPDYEWVGTCYVIDEDILATNRHVASIFARREAGRFVFVRNPLGLKVGARVDFREEFGLTAAQEIEIEEVLDIVRNQSGAPDLAFLRMKRSESNPAPLSLSSRRVRRDDPVAIVGYPAKDSRNDGVVMSRLFEEIYDKKRMAPGLVSALGPGDMFEHDCSTLGGNSGSPVLNSETGEVVGIHFSGRFRVANYAYSAEAIRERLARVRSMVGGGGERRDASRDPGDYENREGFDENFLGAGHRIPMPVPEAFDDLVLVNSRTRGIARHALDYSHFSVVMKRSRRTALYTAVNIDGRREVTIRRRNTEWRLDPRISEEDQVGPEFYVANRIDRGHLVRRIDPSWGSPAEAAQAEEDTFHYTNAAPQHEALNQREWLALEEYILNNANASNLRISVLTGPVFRDQDMRYRDVQIPEEFWKIVCFVDAGGDLKASGYLLSQKPFLDDLEGFEFGRFRTYQVSVQSLEELTGLSLSGLSAVDVFGGAETADPMDRVLIRRLEDIVL